VASGLTGEWAGSLSSSRSWGTCQKPCAVEWSTPWFPELPRLQEPRWNPRIMGPGSRSVSDQRHALRVMAVTRPTTLRDGLAVWGRVLEGVVICDGADDAEPVILTASSGLRNLGVPNGIRSHRARAATVGHRWPS